NEIAKLLQYRYRIVTLDGDVVNPGGSMTGGASKQNTASLLTRKSELEDLKTKIIEMETKTKQLEQVWEGVRTNLVKEEERLHQVRINGEELRGRQTDLEAEIAKIEMSKKNIDERLAIYDLETSELKNEKDKISERDRKSTRLNSSHVKISY